MTPIPNQQAEPDKNDDEKGIPEHKWPRVVAVQNRRIKRAIKAMERWAEEIKKQKEQNDG